MRLAKDGGLVLTLPEAMALTVALVLLVTCLFLINLMLGWVATVFFLLLAMHTKAKRHDRNDD